MQKLLLNLILGLTAVVLLAAVALGLYIGSIDPNAYKSRLTHAVREATGRELVFEGDIELRFFPSPGLKIGKMLMRELPEAEQEFGGEPFLTAAGASVSLALDSLLEGGLDIHEVTLYGARLNMISSAAGRSNWEIDFGAKPRPILDASSSAGAVPLAAPVAPAAGNEGATAISWRVGRVACPDASILYRDLRTGRACRFTFDAFHLDCASDVGPKPVTFSGRFLEEGSGLKGAFSLEGKALRQRDGDCLLDIQECRISAEGLAPVVYSLTQSGRLSYDSASSLLVLDNWRGRLSAPGLRGFDGEAGPPFSAGFAGMARLAGGEETKPGLLSGELHFESLDLDFITGGTRSPAASGTTAIQGAPNLTRPKVTVVTRGRPADSGTAPSLKGLFSNLDMDLELAANRLVFWKLPFDDARFGLNLEQAAGLNASFNGVLFDGGFEGQLKGVFAGETPVFTMQSRVQNLELERATAFFEADYRIGGLMTGTVGLTARGGSYSEMMNSLGGKLSVQVRKGAISGFTLIPSDLPHLVPFPDTFPYERLTFTADIDKGTATSKDILLEAAVLDARGGGVAHLVQGQLDIGLDFRLGGKPPAVPVSISGPYGALSASVDKGLFQRNVNEKKAIEQMRNRAYDPEATEELLLRNMRNPYDSQMNW